MPGPEDVHSADLELLREFAREAGNIALRYFGENPQVWLKVGQSPVSEADYAVDTFLREGLLAARPTYGWLSEETVDSAERLSAARTFVVDPIDGTRAFLQGLDVWCVSLAIVENGRPLAGVLECPVRRETFWATAGGRAWKNGARLTAGPAGPSPAIAGAHAFVEALPQHVRADMRRMPYVPSLAYRIAMIADRALDATFIKPNAQDWDLAAADLILHEAGGEVRDRSGVALRYARRETAHGPLVAANAELSPVMVETLRKVAENPSL